GRKRETQDRPHLGNSSQRITAGISSLPAYTGSGLPKAARAERPRRATRNDRPISANLLRPPRRRASSNRQSIAAVGPATRCLGRRSLNRPSALEIATLIFHGNRHPISRQFGPCDSFPLVLPAISGVRR